MKAKRSKQPNQVEIKNEKSATPEKEQPKEVPDQKISKDDQMIKVELTEAQLDDKLIEFRGLNNEIDGETSKTIGKLLIDESEEKVNPDSETLKKLMKLVGGFKIVLLALVFQSVIHYQHYYEDLTNKEFAATDPEKQGDLFYNYMLKAAYVSSAGLIIRSVKDGFFSYYQRHMAKGIVKDTLTKVLLAPVNLFFDVTPVGKILRIFQSEINVFNHILEPVKHCLGMGAHVVVVITMLFNVGSWEVLVGFVAMMYLVNKVIWPYLYADNQLHKVGSTLWGPIHSYFYECMRGVAVIRAFG